MSIVNQTIEILDDDLLEITGKSKIKRKEAMGIIGDYLDEFELRNPDNGNEFYPDDVLKGCLKEIGEPIKKVMKRSTLLKLFGGAAKEAGMIDY